MEVQWYDPDPNKPVQRREKKDKNAEAGPSSGKQKKDKKVSKRDSASTSPGDPKPDIRKFLKARGRAEPDTICFSSRIVHPTSLQAS